MWWDRRLIFFFHLSNLGLLQSLFTIVTCRGNANVMTRTPLSLNSKFWRYSFRLYCIIPAVRGCCHPSLGVDWSATMFS